MLLYVKEIFSTLQGEGAEAGRPAVFIRLSGCNMWSGREEDRERGKGHCAAWCDTAFADGVATEIDDALEQVWNLCKDWEIPFVVITGGEPGLQLKKTAGETFVKELLELHPRMVVSIETNGSVDAAIYKMARSHLNPTSRLLLTVSPKALVGSSDAGHIKVRTGTELKVVTHMWDIEALEQMRSWSFLHFFVVPKDTGDRGIDKMPTAIDVATRFGWRVSVQAHKYLGLR